MIEAMPQIGASLRQSAQLRTDAGADGSNAVDAAGKVIRGAFGDAAARRAAELMAANTAAFNKAQFRRTVKSVIGVDPLTAEPWLRDMLSTTVTANVSLIKNIGEQTAVQVEQLVTTALRNGTGQDDLAGQIQERFNVSDRRATLIARDQVSKLNGDLTKQRQTDIGVRRYIWRTAGDERVRDSHEAHEGKTYDWNDPPADTGHPGDDINCRCFAEADLDDLLTELENS